MGGQCERARVMYIAAAIVSMIDGVLDYDAFDLGLVCGLA